MKTTLRTLICTALCCAASSAFAMGGPPAPTTTSMAFKGTAGCAGASVGSVTLTGNSNPDVYLQSTTTVTSGGAPATSGFAQIQIATDGLGHPTSLINNTCWVALNTLETPVNGAGQACIPLDLEGLSSLTATDCNDLPVTLTNVNCTTVAQNIGFRIHYVGQGDFGTSFSGGLDLTIEPCASACGTNTNFTIGEPQITGAGNPCPGTHHCWSYVISVQNCTNSAMTNVKIQGGTSAWLDAVQSVTNDKGFNVTFKNTGRNNRVWTLTGSLAQGATVNVTVNVCGTVSNNCDEVMYLSGPWSATGTKVTDSTVVTTGYNGRASTQVDCDTGTCQP